MGPILSEMLLRVSARLAALVASLECLVCLAVNVDFARCSPFSEGPVALEFA